MRRCPGARPSESTATTKQWRSSSDDQIRVRYITIITIMIIYGINNITVILWHFYAWCCMSTKKYFWTHPFLIPFMMTSSMETFPALLLLCVGNSPVTGEFPIQRGSGVVLWSAREQRPVTRSFDFFYLHLNKRLSKQSWGWWSETPLRSLRRHCNVYL